MMDITAGKPVKWEWWWKSWMSLLWVPEWRG
jgi:hypothetical protein